MFNSPILDVTIGIVFIFLLYSLLATTVNEAIATAFSLRARMLRNAIVERMLADIKPGTRWSSIMTGVKEFFEEVFKIITGYKKQNLHPKIGDHFYLHPLIKNYGASKVYPTPSYITSHNFSTILIEVLKDEFHKRLPDIAAYKFTHSTGEEPLELISQQLTHSHNVVKVKEIIEFYGRHYGTPGSSIKDVIIDKETWQLLDMHLRESGFDYDRYIKRIENWFDDTMDRVSGWYKRQTQLVLLLLGLSIAILFNVDAIQITQKLSTDREATGKLVELAVQTADQYKEDPRVTKPDTVEGSSAAESDSSENYRIFKEYQDKLNAIVKLTSDTLKQANDILALGWGESQKEAMVTNTGRKILGFVITAFAISLGAPFWFDLLNKLIRVRGTGKKEGNENIPATERAPVTIQVSGPQRDDAVG
jgi:hypothetical protein